MHDKVDVLIIGSGASGAAVAWSLAETRMHIVCLEQGDWVKPTGLSDQWPRLGGAPVQRLRHQSQPARPRHRLSDQRRQLPDQGGELQRRRRPAPSCTRRTTRASTLRTSRFKTLDGVADDWPLDYATLEPFFTENDRMMGVAGLAGDSRLSATPAAHAAVAARQVGPALRQGAEQARLALVAVGLGDCDHRV